MGNCNFHNINLKSVNRKKSRQTVIYTNIAFTIKQFLYCKGLLDSAFNVLPSITWSLRRVNAWRLHYSWKIFSWDLSQLLSQVVLVLLASWLCETNHLKYGIHKHCYQSWNRALISNFTKIRELVFCRDVNGLLIKLGIKEY